MKKRKPPRKFVPICLYCSKSLRYAGQISCQHCGKVQRRGRLRRNPVDLDRVGRAVIRLWRESGLPRTLLALEKISDEYAAVYRLPRGDVYEAAEAAWHRTATIPIRHSGKYPTVRWRDNPGRGVIGEIPGRLLEIRYNRNGPGVSREMAGLYKHPFKDKAKILALANGGLLILPTGRKRLWVRLPH